MTLRKMRLPDGWYPHHRNGVEETLKKWDVIPYQTERKFSAGIVPHAGWYFSGREAWTVIRGIPDDTETVIVAGGHLPQGSPFLCWEQDFYETPLGNLKINRELFDVFCSEAYVDDNTDNTIEIQLPLIKTVLPDVTVLAVRLPPDKIAFDWGADVGKFCKENKIKAFFLGSTDLTHYGANYGNFLYRNSADPLKEARNKDRELLESLAAGDISGSLISVEKWQTACSVGAALGAAGFASSLNKLPGEVLSLTGSSDKLGDHSNFVNYGTVVF